MTNKFRSSNLKIRVYNILIKLLKPIMEKFTPSAKEIWENQYKGGKWDYLKQLSQHSRYSLIIGYIQELKKNAKILDVGCGEGILSQKICSSYYSYYKGIDFSKEAIEMAKEKKSNKDSFEIVDAFKYQSSEKFDVIVFNEILYYFKDNKILDLVNKYEKFLTDKGIFIVSMYFNERTNYISKLLEGNYFGLDKVKLINYSGKKWICEVFQKKG